MKLCEWYGLSSTGVIEDGKSAAANWRRKKDHVAQSHQSGGLRKPDARSALVEAFGHSSFESLTIRRSIEL